MKILSRKYVWNHIQANSTAIQWTHRWGLKWSLLCGKLSRKVKRCECFVEMLVLGWRAIVSRLSPIIKRQVANNRKRRSSFLLFATCDIPDFSDEQRRTHITAGTTICAYLPVVSKREEDNRMNNAEENKILAGNHTGGSKIPVLKALRKCRAQPKRTGSVRYSEPYMYVLGWSWNFISLSPDIVRCRHTWVRGHAFSQEQRLEQ